jgi:hypothetical protein
MFITEKHFQKWGWFGAQQSVVVFGWSDGKKVKGYMGIQKRREFVRVVSSLVVSARSRGAAVTAGAVVVDPSSPNHLAVHNVVNDDDVVVSLAATAATTCSKQDISENVV